MRVGYDLDGVVADTVWFYERLKWVRPRLILQLASLLAPVILKPSDEDVIITGRDKCDAWVTKLWLWLHGIRCPIYFAENNVPYNPHNAIEFKARKIRELNLRFYVEDDYEVAQKLNNMLHDCLIIYKRDSEFIVLLKDKPLDNVVSIW